jgi:rare lipoprotein A
MQQASIDSQRRRRAHGGARHDRVRVALAAALLAAGLSGGARFASAGPGETVATAAEHADVHAPFEGRISYYAREFAGRLTASGEVFDPEAMTMAHPTLPFGTLVRVTTLHGGRSVVLKVNDRGPFHGRRIADVSPAAARLLGMIRAGLVKARIEVIEPLLSPAAGSRQEPSRSRR